MIVFSVEPTRGYLLDSDGRVVVRFDRWTSGTHQVPEAVESVEAVGASESLDKPVHRDYRPASVFIDVGDDLIADGSDDTTAHISTNLDESVDVSLSVAGSEIWTKRVGPNETMTETITTTTTETSIRLAATAGAGIRETNEIIKVRQP